MTRAVEVDRPGCNAASVQLRPLQPSDLARLSALLRETLEAPTGTAFSAEEMLAWKYLRSDPAWEGALSYVLEKNGALVAHAGVCPALFRSPTGCAVRCGTIIDWAADRGTPGAGRIVHQRLVELADAAFLLGGTATTWALTSRLGFRRRLDARVYARWVRPLTEFRLRPKSPRAVLRLLHGVVRAPLGRLAKTGEWAITPVRRFDAAVQPVLHAAPHSYSRAERTVAQLNHRLECPATATRGYLLRRRDTVAGYAIVAVGRWEAKIVELRLDATDAEDWAAAYALVTDALSREPQVCRISALASVPHLQRALESNSYWVARVEPVSFYDPRHVIDELLPVDIQFFESDLSYYSA